MKEKVKRKDFEKYIEPVLDQEYASRNHEGVIELISPVVKQKREGKGITWRGTYYGEDIVKNDIPIISNGDDIEFYMQDSEFKNQISNKEISFTVGDKMKIIFDVRGEIKGTSFQNRAIYAREVRQYNEEIIPHKEKVERSKKNTKPKDDQKQLFA